MGLYRQFFWILMVGFFCACSPNNFESSYDKDQTQALSNLDLQLEEDHILSGDMILSKSDILVSDHESLKEYYESGNLPDILKSGMVSNDVYFWPNGKLRYKFHSSVTEKQKKIFLKACKEISWFADVECLPKRSGENAFLLVQTINNLDWSYSGLATVGARYQKQTFKIRKDSWERNNSLVLHELMHAFGVRHEHQKPNAADYIKVSLDNVPKEKWKNFSVYKVNQVEMETGYDVNSIMHYDSWAFGNGKVSMVKRGYSRNDPSRFVQSNNRLSVRDHRILVKIYGGHWPSFQNYKALYANRLYTVKRNCKSQLGEWSDCIAVDGIHSIRSLSANYLCRRGGQNAYRREGRYFKVGDGCRGTFEIKFTGHKIFKRRDDSVYDGPQPLTVYGLETFQ